MNRMILTATLRPILGERFQPTSFPDLGAAEYTAPDGRPSLLVESSASVANHLEAAIWSPLRGELVPALAGMPYVRLRHPELGLLTSITEANRLASPYLFPWLKERLEQSTGGVGVREKEAHEVAPALLAMDPNCLVHGCFFAKLKPVVRVTRLLTAFLDADGVEPVHFGGVKRDRANPSGPAAENKGNIPFSRTEYVSNRLRAFFNLDLVQLASYGLSPSAESFLRDLSWYKVRRFLDAGLRLRSACDLVVEKLEGSFELPGEEELAWRLGQSLAELRASGELGEVWELSA